MPFNSINQDGADNSINLKLDELYGILRNCYVTLFEMQT
jgi:hypothetical protein